MTHLVVLLLILGGAALYFMTIEERSRTKRLALAIAREIRRAMTLEDLQATPFCVAVRERSRWAVVTPAICVLSVAAFALKHTDGRESSVEFVAMTLLAHSGTLHLLVDIIGLLQIGMIVERIVGSFAFAAVFVSAAMSTALLTLFGEPSMNGVGASAGVLAIYGLLLALVVWTILRRSALTIPFSVLARLAPGAALFFLYLMATDRLHTAPAIAGIMIGYLGGLVLVRDVGKHKPPMRRVAATVAAAVAVSAVAAVFLRHPAPENIDVKFEVERVIAIEAHTTHVYDKAVERFKRGGVTADSLTSLIERTILPELRAASVRLRTLDGIPPERKPLVSAAENYLTLRDESWRLRASALRASDVAKLREADRKEQASLALLRAVTQTLKS